jgi:hypothetical protein
MPYTREFVTDVFDEQRDEDVVLVLAGSHAAAQFVATGPERAVESRKALKRETRFCFALDSSKPVHATRKLANLVFS